jgi:hypothetical protein
MNSFSEMESEIICLKNQIWNWIPGCVFSLELEGEPESYNIYFKITRIVTSN